MTWNYGTEAWIADRIELWRARRAHAAYAATIYAGGATRDASDADHEAADRLALIDAVIRQPGPLFPAAASAHEERVRRGVELLAIDSRVLATSDDVLLAECRRVFAALMSAP